MSITMKVAVGYGLDLAGLNTEFISDLDNMESENLFKEFVADALKSAEDRGDLSDKIAIGYAVGAKFHAVAPNKVPRGFDETTEYDPEFAFKDKLLLYPLGYRERWSRRANNLDAFIYEAYQTPGEFDLETEWREKLGTLYPFVGLMRPNPDKPLGVEGYWANCYLDNTEHRDAIPKAPMHLWHLIKHLRLVPTDEDVTKAFLSLRPTFMRWWS